MRSRYQQQMRLPEVGESGQKKLSDAKVLIVGVGGLGTPCAMYLAGAGIGSIGLVDFDVVDESNLHRQVLYAMEDIGKPKVEVAKRRLEERNPEIEIQSFNEPVSVTFAQREFLNYDVIVDGTDNFSSKYLINDACVLLERPLVAGSISGYSGMIGWFSTSEGPCYRCLYPESPDKSEIPSCSQGGVLGPLPGMLGTFQAMEVIKFLTGVGELLERKVMRMNLEYLEFKTFHLNRDPDCPICREKMPVKFLEEQNYELGQCQNFESIAYNQIRGIFPLQLLDVRERDEFKKGHLPHARNFPLSELDSWSLKVDSELKIEKSTVVYCQRGVRSRKAAAFLKKRGWTNVKLLTEGYDHLMNRD